MPVAIKICGLNSAAAADAAIAAGAAYGGLVFHPDSPRNLTLEDAGALARRMRGRLKIVALLSDPADEQVASVKGAVAPDLLQLHGRESVARVADIRARFGLPVVKALPLADAADLAAVAAYEPVADMFLFDAKPPDGAARGGGHGASFDWKILSGRGLRKPWFLAGGLNPENVARAIEASGASLVDVSSGVESAPGVKSPALIAGFAAAARERVRA